MGTHTSARANEPLKTISFMTYNTHLFDTGAAAARWTPAKQIVSGLAHLYFTLQNMEPLDFFDTKRAGLMTWEIRRMKKIPDFIALQEVWTSDVRDIFLEDLSATHPYAYRPEVDTNISAGKFVGNGLLFMSKHPIVEGSGQFTFFDQLSGDSAWSRKGVASIIVELPGKKQLGVVFTHTAGEYSNICQMFEHAQRFQRPGSTMDFIMVGDLNIHEDVSINFRKCADESKLSSKALPLHDAYRELNPEKGDYPGGTCDQEPPARLDYVLYSAANVLDRALDITIDNDRFYFYPPASLRKRPLSDHFPVVAEFALKR